MELISSKKRLQSLEGKLSSVDPGFFDFVDKIFNIPRFLDRVYLQKLLIKKYKQTLDIGSGKGSLASLLFKHTDKLVCLDISKKNLDILRKRIQDKIANIKIVNTKAERLPFKDNSFDLIFSNCVLEHIKQDDQVFLEISRCLKPGGDLILALPNRSMNPGLFKTFLLANTQWRFLADAEVQQYFAFSDIKKAEKWYAIRRWQHVRRGYDIGGLKKRLLKMKIRVLKSFYYPSQSISEFWEIMTFSKLNSLFPFTLFLLAPLFYLWPKKMGTKKTSLALAILARKDKQQ